MGTKKNVAADPMANAMQQLLRGHATELDLVLRTANLLGALADRVNGMAKTIEGMSTLTLLNTAALVEIRAAAGLPEHPAYTAAVAALSTVQNMARQPSAPAGPANDDIGAPVGTA